MLLYGYTSFIHIKIRIHFFLIWTQIVFQTWIYIFFLDWVSFFPRSESTFILDWNNRFREILIFFPLWIKTNSCTEPHFSLVHISQVERSRNWSSDYFRVKRGRSVPRGQWGRRETRATMDTTGSPASPDKRENRAVKGHNHTKHYDTKTTF